MRHIFGVDEGHVGGEFTVDGTGEPDAYTYNRQYFLIWLYPLADPPAREAIPTGLNLAAEIGNCCSIVLVPVPVEDSGIPVADVQGDSTT